ncbi:flavodoxin [Corynebacterium canis]|uniref:Flavodoxin n=1 Tax=Corynebacterium canis TaxID=679663 RepID=A0A5C5UI53_9CORY|nr:flavodoxin domain-containing protein [Corynebacterium canis]TWT25005.1 flavodoxin [Corynebacterium canis]WJY76116.1 hypothetical protein CCANI_11490 [Corynebacterium canis]
MKALILHESYFGNTKTVAESIAAGISDRGVTTLVTPIADAPDELPEDLDILILGAPTHDRKLPSAASRDKAVAAGGAPTSRGVADWLDQAELPEHLYIAVFDTSTGKNWLSGSAAKRMAKLLGQRKPPLKPILKTFLVSGNEGPLADGELDAARTWGRLLAADARQKHLQNQ